MAEILKPIFIPLFFIILKIADINACITQTPCVCDIDEYNRIDLTQVAQKLKSDDFLADEDLHRNSFFFHGCSDGTFNATTHNYHVNSTIATFSGSLIHVNTSFVNTSYPGSNYTNFTALSDVQVAKSSQIKFVQLSGDKNVYQIVYKNGDNVTARIQLICSEFQTSFIKILSTDGTDPSLALISPFACIVPHSAGLSTGSVFLIILFIAFGIYFFGGCLLLYFIRGARGIEMIPNIDFWRSVPGLVKNGLIFIFSGCRGTSITTAETYDKI